MMRKGKKNDQSVFSTFSFYFSLFDNNSEMMRQFDCHLEMQAFWLSAHSHNWAKIFLYLNFNFHTL